MADLANTDLSMSERIELGGIRAELSVSSDRGVLELFAELDDPEYTPGDFKRLPAWATGENLGNGVLLYTSDFGRMRELVELAADFLGAKRPDAAPGEPRPPRNSQA